LEEGGAAGADIGAGAALTGVVVATAFFVEVAVLVATPATAPAEATSALVVAAGSPTCESETVVGTGRLVRNVNATNRSASAPMYEKRGRKREDIY
jgi:hypothetical protein